MAAGLTAGASLAAMEIVRGCCPFLLLQLKLPAALAATATPLLPLLLLLLLPL